MNGKEFRIGNMVAQKLNDKIIPERIAYLYGNALVTTRGQSIPFGADYLIGIPLNKEWLTRAGFEAEGEVAGRLKIDTDFGEVTIMLNGSERLCKYLHQLQNIYFALTGEELNIK